MNPWGQTIWRMTILLVIALLIGAWLGNILLLFTLSLAVILAWHLYQMYRMERWLRCSKKIEPPEAQGIWGEIFYQIYRLQQRNRKRKRKLANMLKRFQASTAAMPDGTVVLDGQYRIEWLNKAAQKLLGLKNVQDIGQPIVNLLRYPHFKQFLLSDAQVRPDSIELRAPNNTQKVLRLYIVPYAGQRYLLIARDITHLQHLEQIRQNFVANISQELHAPLTTMQGFVATLQTESQHEAALAPCQSSLNAIAEQTQKMQSIINDLMLLSRLESSLPLQLDQQPRINLSTILPNLCAQASTLSGEKKHLIHLEMDKTVELYGQTDEIRNAFANLIFNAVQYTPAHSTINIRWYADEQGLHFAVKDTGDGIAAQHLPHLSERFYRIDVGRSRQQGGTGLGLAIVKHVLIRHHAKLRIHSQEGHGSEFICDFPVPKIPII